VLIEIQSPFLIMYSGNIKHVFIFVELMILMVMEGQNYGMVRFEVME